MKNVRWLVIILILLLPITIFGLWINGTMASPTPNLAQSKNLTKESSNSSAKMFHTIGKVVIDPGHGGRFPGTCGRNGLLEKNVVLSIGLKLRTLLEAKGIKVVMTRETDQHFSANLNEDLNRRVSIANSERPNLFISLHANWYRNPELRGFEIYYSNHKPMSEYKNETTDLIDEVQESLGSLVKYRSVKARDLQVIRNVKCPAILVEVEYLSNQSACQDLAQESYRLSIAEKLCEAILNFGEGNEKDSSDE